MDEIKLWAQRRAVYLKLVQSIGRPAHCQYGAPPQGGSAVQNNPRRQGAMPPCCSHSTDHRTDNPFGHAALYSSSAFLTRYRKKKNVLYAFLPAFGASETFLLRFHLYFRSFLCYSNGCRMSRTAVSSATSQYGCLQGSSEEGLRGETSRPYLMWIMPT